MYTNNTPVIFYLFNLPKYTKEKANLQISLNKKKKKEKHKGIWRSKRESVY